MMKTLVAALLAVSACSDDAPIEMPTEHVACGDGAAGEVLGSVRAGDMRVELGDVMPSYRRGGSDSPGVLILIPSDSVFTPQFSMYLWGNTTPQYPNAGGQPLRDAYLHGGGTSDMAPAQTIIDEVETTTTPVCIAGRFLVDFDGETTGRLAGWFRTR